MSERLFVLGHARIQVPTIGLAGGAYRMFQVPISRIESLTQLSFGWVVAADPLADFETPIEAKEVTQQDQLIL